MTRVVTVKATPLPWPPELDAEATQMWNDGYSAAQIGNKIGRSRCAVLGRLMRIDVRRSKVTEEAVTKCRIAALRKEMLEGRAAAMRGLYKPERKAPSAPRIKPPRPVVETVVVFNPDGCCRWPDGCNLPRERGSYCEAHAERAYVRTPKMDERKVARWFR